MLSQIKVDEYEEQLRKDIQQLSEEDRKLFYKTVKNEIKDPDTYAALNWFFITGIHHFYLGKWVAGLIDLFSFIIGIMIMIYGYPFVGIAFIVFVSLLELWALFRAQIIVQDWNNRIQRSVLQDIQK